MIRKCSGGAGIHLASPLLPGGVVIHLAPSPPIPQWPASCRSVGPISRIGQSDNRLVGRSVAQAVILSPGSPLSAFYEP